LVARIAGCAAPPSEPCAWFCGCIEKAAAVNRLASYLRGIICAAGWERGAEASEMVAAVGRRMVWGRAAAAAAEANLVSASFLPAARPCVYPSDDCRG